VITKAKQGDLRACQDILDRAYGRPRQSIDATTNGKDITSHPIIIQDKETAEEIAKLYK